MSSGDLLVHLKWKPGGLLRGTWTVRQGEQWVVTGPNGSGKTYLSLLMTGMIPPINVEASYTDGFEAHTALVTFAQQSSLAGESWLQARWHAGLEADGATVRDFLSFEAVNDINPFEVRSGDTEARRGFAGALRRVLARLDIRDLLSRRLYHLSNGETRKILIARALLRAPKLLVLDDPFSGLDTDSRERLQDLLAVLAADGLTMVVTVRRQDEIPGFATHRLALSGRGGFTKGLLEKRSVPFPAAVLPVKTEKKRVIRETGEEVAALHNVTIRLGRRDVLKNVTWTVRKGERWLLLGPNGSGKSTLLSLITGDNPAAYGQDVRVFGRPRGKGESLWEIRRRIGQVSPEIQCYFDTTQSVLDTVLSGRIGDDGRPLPVSRTEREAALVLLGQLGLADTAHRLLSELSPGAIRLVLLARALFPKPELLILDEPCQNLDDAARKTVFRLLSKVLRKGFTDTVILTAHHPDDVPPGFERVFRLE